MRLFVIADTHFGHAKIIQYENRPYETVEMMDADMITRWNARVNEDDLVFHLGDFSLHGAVKTKEIARQLKGQKMLILGNHDRSRTVSFWLKAGFIRVFENAVEVENLILSHEPLKNSAKVNLHGHLHGQKPDPILIDGRHRCVSVELIDYTPLLVYESQHKTLMF